MELLKSDFRLAAQPSETYKLQIEADRIAGWTDGLPAVAQSVYLILNIERYEHIIYSWNYGVELSSLFGKPAAFVIPELKRRITEALLQDRRITAVDNFSFGTWRSKVHAAFTVHSIYGDIDAEKEVQI